MAFGRREMRRPSVAVEHAVAKRVLGALGLKTAGSQTEHSLARPVGRNISLLKR